jgi:hypothetical protein
MNTSHEFGMEKISLESSENKSDLKIPPATTACITPEQAQNISTLEANILKHQEDTNTHVGMINEQLKIDIQTINSQATQQYDTVNKEANDRITNLQLQIEQISQKTSDIQREIYANICVRTQQAKEAANKHLYSVQQARSDEVRRMNDDLKKQKYEAGLPAEGVQLVEPLAMDCPSSVMIGTCGNNHGNQCNMGGVFNVSGSGRNGGSSTLSASSSHEGETRAQLIARGMALYQVSRKQMAEINESGGVTDTEGRNLVSNLTDGIASVLEKTEPVVEEVESTPPFIDPPKPEILLLCEYAGCDKRRSCNFQGEKHGRFCGSHKLAGMINVMIKRCEATGCSKMPGFNFEGESERRFCAAHKLEGMVNIKASSNPVLIVPTNTSSEKKPTAPTSHHALESEDLFAGKRLLQSEDVEDSHDQRPRQKAKMKGGRCEADMCNKHPSFNFKGLIGGRFCSAHKLPGMQDVISKRCEDCAKQAAFNFEGQSRGRFCSSHKSPGMINVKDKLCEMVGCSKYPTANFAGHSGRRFCTSHKLDGMINFTNKRCEAIGCIKHPKFNFLGKPGRRFCGVHKLNGMVAIS